MTKQRYQTGLAIGLITIGIISFVIIESNYAINTEIRWTFFSGKYKSRVLGQPNSNADGLRHIEWGGWGWAGQDTTVFLVYDPKDLLAAAARSGQPGKYDGLPCNVYLVHRLESDWYTVQFYTNTYWNQCT